MTKIIVIILSIIIVGEYSFIFYRGFKERANTASSTAKNEATSSNRTTDQPSTTTTSDNCAQFPSRFGITSDELVNYINNQPESATVMKDFDNITGTIVAQESANNIPITIKLDNTAKITSWQCEKANITLDPEKDIDFTIPEADFAMLVRNRDNLDESQAANYLQSLTTNPPSAKQTIILRIQSQ